jgi:hypothetical protein
LSIHAMSISFAPVKPPGWTVVLSLTRRLISYFLSLALSSQAGLLPNRARGRENHCRLGSGLVGGRS